MKLYLKPPRHPVDMFHERKETIQQGSGYDYVRRGTGVKDIPLPDPGPGGFDVRHQYSWPINIEKYHFHIFPDERS